MQAQQAQGLCHCKHEHAPTRPPAQPFTSRRHSAASEHVLTTLREILVIALITSLITKNEQGQPVCMCLCPCVSVSVCMCMEHEERVKHLSSAERMQIRAAAVRLSAGMQQAHKRWHHRDFLASSASLPAQPDANQANAPLCRPSDRLHTDKGTGHTRRVRE